MKQVRCLVLLVIILGIGLMLITPDQGSAAWWDKFGEPKYGGELSIRYAFFEFAADLTQMQGTDKIIWMESLFASDWTVDRNIWSFPSSFVPEEYIAGLLAESWEYTDSQTVTVKIRDGIHWQDKPPVNGRELTAEDVQYSYDRYLGTGSGFTEPNPFWAGTLHSIDRVVATDKNTVEFKLKQPGATAIYQILEAKAATAALIVAKEWVEQGDTDNWKNAVGTGPWMLTDVVQGSSLTYSRNPNYWGYDERHPKNQIPYLDTLKHLVIPDQATALAAMRTGKIDMMVADRSGVLTLQQAKNLARTNPDIVQATWPGPGSTLEIKCDNEPFTDIRVRKALNMAIDRELIAKTYYAGNVDGKPCGVIAPYLTDYAFTYDEWPQSLKNEYSFDPEGAKALLAEAAADGVFEVNEYGGFDTNCLATQSDAVDLLEIIKAEYLEVGVDMEIITMDGATMRGYTTKGSHDAMVLNARMAMPFSPMEALNMRTYTNRGCLTFNNDDYFANMVAKIDTAATMAEAQAMFKEADKYNLEQHWSVYVCPTIINIAWQPWVKGYSAEHANNGWIGHIPARLWIDRQLKKSQ